MSRNVRGTVIQQVTKQPKPAPYNLRRNALQFQFLVRILYRLIHGRLDVPQGAFGAGGVDARSVFQAAMVHGSLDLSGTVVPLDKG